MAGADFGIRQAGSGDLSTLPRLYRQLQPADNEIADDTARDRFDRILAQPGMSVFLATSGDEAVATVTLVIIPNLTRGGASYGLIENVVTDPAHRKRGHAGALIRHAFQRAWDAGCYKVMLLSGSKDPATLDFYRHCGFTQDKTGFQIRRPAGI